MQVTSIAALWRGIRAVLPPSPRPVNVTEEADQQAERERAASPSCNASTAPDYVVPISVWRGQTIFIEYVNGLGQRLGRRISIRDMWDGPAGSIYIEAFCHERRAPRQFRSDRILEVADVVTGEIFPCFEDWLATLAVLATAEQPGSAAAADAAVADLDSQATLRRPFDEAWRQVADGCAVLVYLARVDGRFVREEELALASWIFDHLESSEAGAAMRVARGLMPTDDEFLEALVRCAAVPIAGRIGLVSAASALIRADGEVHLRERSMLDALRRSLDLPA